MSTSDTKLRNHLCYLSLGVGLSLLGYSAAVDKSTPEASIYASGMQSPSRPGTSDEADQMRLRKKVLAEKKALLKTKQLAYLTGVAVGVVQPGLRAVHTATANALYYLDSRYGVLTARTEVTEEQFIAEVYTLKYALSKRGYAAEPGEVAATLFEAEEAKEKAYIDLLARVPVRTTSKTGYLSYLVAECVPKEASVAAAKLADCVRVLSRASGFEIPVRVISGPTFDMLRACLDRYEVAVLLSAPTATPQSSVTAVGYLLDAEARYLIVHNPTTAVPKRVAATSLMSEKDRSSESQWAKRVYTVLSEQGELQEDHIGSFDHTSFEHIPRGVEFYSAAKLKDKHALIIGKPRRDIDYLWRLAQKHIKHVKHVTSSAM